MSRAPDTIYALSSGAPPAGVAVLRISGPRSGEILRTLGGALPQPRLARYAALRDPDDGELIDRGLCLWFPAPGSATGEDVAELHVHGGSAVLAALTGILDRFDRVRLAEPGEFTRRGFENGKMDLSAAEGIGDLVAAETEAQLRQALRQSGGELARFSERLRQDLIRVQSHLEASIDFVEEEIPDDVLQGVADELQRIESLLAAQLSDRGSGERLRQGISVAVVGPPNVGKSSLVNALARRDVAIVTEQAGTTRDVIDVHLNIGGYPVILADTAGLRELEGAPEDIVEREGIRRARERAEAADIRIAVFQADLVRAAELEDAVRAGDLVVLNKIDLAGGPSLAGDLDAAVIRMSIKEESGIDDLIGRLADKIAEDLPPGGAALITRSRHRDAFLACRDAVVSAKDAGLPELAAEEVRRAVQAIGRITGRVDVEDMLDVVFREFCIGK